MKKSFFLPLIILLCSVTGICQEKRQNVMLILGSAIPEALASRVEVASRFYNRQKIDKIIVSGGCGAHSSAICEASEMKKQLMDRGVPGNIIYKEENSKTTVQNYIFSRVLKDETGKQIIQKDDSLFVVSNHWHAIAIAARFNKFDQVHARFVIEGDVVPKPNDMLDYAGIFNSVADNKIFVVKGVWPTPGAVFTDKGVTQYLFSDRVYSQNNNNASEPLVSDLSTFKVTLPIHWNEIDATAKDDAKNRLLLFHNLECQIILSGKNTSSVVKINELIAGLPSGINSVDASFIKDNDLFLFVGSKVIVAQRVGAKFRVSKMMEIHEWMPNWPYGWGSGDLAAADYDRTNKTIFLYKNREVLKIVPGISEALPQKLKLKWKDIENQSEK